MDKLREITRLNLALELVSECAGLVDVDAVARVVGERMRWLFDFDVCVLALRIGGAVRWLSMRSGDEGLAVMPDDHAVPIRSLAERAMGLGSPAASGQPLLALAYPLGDVARPLGALCIEGSGAYSNRDLRFLHHVCSGLGTALVRIEQSDHLTSVRTLAAARDRAASDEARAANDAKDTFLAMLGHELRNPLAPILAAVELVRRDPLGPTLARVEIVERQARHLNRLVGDLLDVSRVTSGKVTLRRSAVDLRDVAAKAAEMARPRMLGKGQNLTMDLPGFAVMVDGDEARLAQVACNLLNNASAYSARGAQVELLLRSGVGEALLEVRDEGIGIAPELLGSIFELFVQGGRSKEVAPGGLGLGLGVSRALVNLHRGTISASSEGEGRGSVFRVALPLLPAGAPELAQAASGTGESAPADGPRIPRRILLVDDNKDAADSTGELLRDFGHEVLVAYGPLEALASAMAFAPEVAVLDIGLQIMDGYELARELHTRLGCGAPAMIALSGYGQERDRKRSAESGFAAHLVKPVSLSELLANIESARAGPSECMAHG
ncbi:ATP-binding protein [Variovorax sp. J22R133]|uniref:hybrid sensor histidine kinase/response regulator n=1 Tax=Variovorax brevis TaxID=3053503 RepID=UPI002578BA75|nr:ATP-binding protein [Variovorax sp. J22R133]MDM0117122.1 ATP-binding protein [Variovorax sp. J22R133]